MCANPKKGHTLAPTRIVFVDAETGERTADDEAEKRLAHVKDLPAVGWVRRRFPPSQIDAREDELFALYDALTPWFVRHLRLPAGPAVASVFLERLGELEPQLTPYYRGAAPEFFGWVDAQIKTAR